MALEMLQAGVDRAVIALWLGHESVETTQIYLEATLAMKEQGQNGNAPRKSKTLPTGRSTAELSQRPVVQGKLCRVAERVRTRCRR